MSKSNKDNKNNNINNKEEKREKRHKRRIKNQIIAFIVALIIIAACGYGAYVGISALARVIKEKGEPIDEIISSNEVVSEDKTQGVIATPNIEEIEAALSDDISDTTEETTEEDENAKVQEYINSLTLEQKVASLFVVTPESITGANLATQAGEGTKNALLEYHVGGIIYKSDNVESHEAFVEMIKNTKAFYNEMYGIDVWTFVREEGAVNVIGGSKAGVVKVDSAKDIGLTGDNGNAYTAYITIGSYLKDYSIDVNLGPVCSVKLNDNSFIGDRAFSNDIDITTSMVGKAVDGQVEQGIITCLTAFPGEGDLTVDTAAGESKTNRTLDDMRSSEFLPFEAGIEKGATMIMMSHMIAGEATGEEVPCSMSAVMIRDILRGELGFDGIVISDDMSKKAITNKYNSGEAAVIAINAGCDMILTPANFTEAYNAVLQAVQDGTISEERLNEALMRIYSEKFKNK